MAMRNYLQEWGGREAHEGGEYMYVYSGFMLLYSRNQHNIVKQFSFN